jgi:uncharacterized protein (TIGR02145 family)
MKKTLAFSFTLLCLGSFAQTLQNINKSTGTVSNPISQIDSIRFNTATNQMEVVLQSGVETHALTDVLDVSFASGSNACGFITSVTDIDGNVYPVVGIGSQCWTKENLRVTKYRDGSIIPLDESGGATGDGTGQIWSSRTTGARTVNGHNAINLATYGYLYNWYAVSDIKGLCPNGWHVPFDGDWTVMIQSLDPSQLVNNENVFIFLGTQSTIVGGKLKKTGTTYWSSPNTGATNEIGFSILPGGNRNSVGSFSNIRNGALFWSASVVNSKYAWRRSLSYNDGGVARFFNDKQDGFSVRCLKD